MNDTTHLRDAGIGYINKRFPVLHSQADDIVQDVTIRLYFSEKEYGNLKAVFFQSISNRCIDIIRTPYFSRTSSLDALVKGLEEKLEDYRERNDSTGFNNLSFDDQNTEPSSEAIYDQKFKLDEIIEVIKTLSIRRQACMIGCLLGMTCPEISKTLGISLPAAKKGVRYGKQQLKQKLNEKYMENEIESIPVSVSKP